MSIILVIACFSSELYLCFSLSLSIYNCISIFLCLCLSLPLSPSPSPSLFSLFFPLSSLFVPLFFSFLSFYSILFYSILFYSILFYSILFYSIHFLTSSLFFSPLLAISPSLFIFRHISCCAPSALFETQSRNATPL